MQLSIPLHQHSEKRGQEVNNKNTYLMFKNTTESKERLYLSFVLRNHQYIREQPKD